MKTLIILMMLSFSVSAETRLIIPFLTTHIGTDSYNEDDIDKPFNENNYGLGVELEKDNLLYSAVYFANNSYYNRSLYASISKEHHIKEFSLSYGVAVATGYDYLTSSGVVFTPVFAIKLGNIRIVTSYPFSHTFHPENIDPADFVNVQAVIGF